MRSADFLFIVPVRALKTALRNVAPLRMAYAKLRRTTITGSEVARLSGLLNEGRTVVLRPFFMMEKSDSPSYEIVRETVEDYLDVHQTVRLSRSTSTRLAFSTGTVLLRNQLALLRIPDVHEEYLKAVGAKTRNMIRKSEKQGYEVREFTWNEYLDDIFDINTSKEIRTAGAMYGWYTQPVQPRYHTLEEQRYRKYYGVFKEERLWAYLNIILCGDFGFFKHFIGHADHLTYGIMNALISSTVRKYIGHSHVKWLSYGTLTDGKLGSGESFRRHAGFEGYAAFLDLDGDQMLLEHAGSARVKGLRGV
jgi:hypothetical protein